MAVNGIDFGGRMSEHHATKILKKKGQHLRLQQHFQLSNQKQPPVAHQKPLQHFPLKNPKPPPVAWEKPVLKKEDLGKLSFAQMRDWLRHFGLSQQTHKKHQIAVLTKHLDLLEKIKK